MLFDSGRLAIGHANARASLRGRSTGAAVGQRRGLGGKLTAAQEAVAMSSFRRSPWPRAASSRRSRSAQLAVAIEVGFDERAVEPLRHFRFALRALALVPGLHSLRTDETVLVGIDGVEVEPAANLPPMRLPPSTAD